MFKLTKANTILHPCRLRQSNEDGSVNEATLRVRFNVIDRAELDRMADAESDDERLIYDVVVNKIEDDVQGEDGEALSEADARAAIRNNLPLSAQIVTQFWELMSGAAAKNAKRSRGR